MGNIKLLDCTLSDGGFVNNWTFDKKVASKIIENLAMGGIDIIEVGYLKDEAYRPSRTVYNSPYQVFQYVTDKRDNSFYSVVVDAEEPLPIEQFEEFNNHTIDIIRVIVWKDELEFGFDYCKKIIQKGYKIILFPACIHQYTHSEFTEMLNLYQQLELFAVYVADSFGSLNTEETLRIIKIADQYLLPQIALGYHGHHNLQQVMQTAKALVCTDLRRDIIIDSSIFGMGSCTGNLQTELFAEYLNQNNDKNYNINIILDTYDNYIKPITSHMSWGYAPIYSLTAKYKCNPDYGYYYYYLMNITMLEIEKVLESIPEEDKITITQKKANNHIISYRRKFWRNKLCVVIPTANRSKDIDYYLTLVGSQFAWSGIDLIIYDSSTDDSIEQIVKKHIKRIEDSEDQFKCARSNIIYKRYHGYFDGISLDEKVIEAYREHTESYEYIWICRDGLIINICQIYNKLYNLYDHHYDIMSVYDTTQDYEHLGERTYTDCTPFFADNCRHMTILGSTILSSSIVSKILSTQPLDKELNYGMWQPIAFFQYIADHDFSAINIVLNIFIPNPYGTPSSFWNKNGNALWQWAERWYIMITSLSEKYDSVKEKVLHIEMADFHPFSLWQLIIMRANGSLTINKFKRNEKYLVQVTDTDLWKIHTIAFLPKWIARALCERPKSLFFKTCHAFFKPLQKIYSKFHRSVPVNTTLPLENPDSFTENIRFSKHQLCVVIPTAGKPDIINDYLKEVLKKFEIYGIDFIIYDSSDNDKTKLIVEKYAEDGFKNVIYKRYDKPVDLKSLDEKVISAYQENAIFYDYIWMMRDRMIIKIDNIAYELKKFIDKNIDIVAIHNLECDYHHVGKKEYTDCVEFFKEQFVQMTVLGQTIMKSKTILNIIEHVPLDKEKNYSLWQPVAFFQYLAEHDFTAASYSAEAFSYHSAASKGSFWMKQILWQWAERFYTMLDLLPDTYEVTKQDVIEEMKLHFNLLSVPYLLAVRINVGLKLRDIHKNKKYIPHVTDTEIWKFYAIALLPKYMAKILQKRPNGYLARCLKCIYRVFKGIRKSKTT